MPSEAELKKMELATLYELRLIFSEGEKANYTKEEILETLDKLAIAKK